MERLGQKIQENHHNTSLAQTTRDLHHKKLQNSNQLHKDLRRQHKSVTATQSSHRKCESFITNRLQNSNLRHNALCRNTRASPQHKYHSDNTRALPQLDYTKIIHYKKCLDRQHKSLTINKTVIQCTDLVKRIRELRHNNIPEQDFTAQILAQTMLEYDY